MPRNQFIALVAAIALVILIAVVGDSVAQLQLQ